MDADTAWSQAAPSAAEEDEYIGARGHGDHGTWHLAVDPDAAEHTKMRYAFPHGVLRRVRATSCAASRTGAGDTRTDEPGGTGRREGARVGIGA